MEKQKTLKRDLSEKMSSQKQKKKSEDKTKTNRVLIIINVLGSAGPIKFLVKEDELVAGVIDTALKKYDRAGRLPVLGFDANNFLLYCTNECSDALKPWEPVGSRGASTFLLCKKQLKPHMTEGRSEIIAKKSSGLKAWLNKSFNLKILSH